MAKKLKIWLIRKLGGITAEESRNNYHEAYKAGSHDTLMLLQQLANRLYGKPAEEWYKEMYDYISKNRERMDKELGI